MYWRTCCFVESQMEGCMKELTQEGEDVNGIMGYEAFDVGDTEAFIYIRMAPTDIRILMRWSINDPSQLSCTISVFVPQWEN